MLVALLLGCAIGAQAFSPPLLPRSTMSETMRPCLSALRMAGDEEARPMLLSEKTTNAPVPSAGGTALTSLLVAVWYAASVVCNQTSKVLVASLGSQTLTLMQLALAMGCGALCCSAYGPSALLRSMANASSSHWELHLASSSLIPLSSPLPSQAASSL